MGGVPTGAGLVDGGVDQGGKGWALINGLAWWTGGQGGGARVGLAVREGRSKFRKRVVFLSFLTIQKYKKEEKWLFGKDALWGGGGTWWTGG